MYENTYHTDDISRLRFLVTGGAGFIGSNIVEYLVKHKAGKITILDNLSTGFLHNIQPFLTQPNVQFIQGDICDAGTCETSCQDIDIVLHQAALGSVPRSIKDPVATNHANVDGFLNIMTAAKNNKAKRFVFASSSSVYGDSQQLPKTEDIIGRPLSPYAVSKYVDELYAQVFARCYNMEIIGLRYFNVFGPNQSPAGAYAAAIPLFIHALITNRSPKIFGDGEQTRDFTFVENAVQANIKAALTHNTEARGEIFNIACGDRTTVNELFQVLKDISGSDIIPVYLDERPGDIRDSLADISKAHQTLGYMPGVKIKDGLELTYKWFSQNFARLYGDI
ncbi:MAG TPA: SDR family oxidoreductase [Bacteroidales bacterium]|nr:SDR family oxidoreductase [Bacteroidales bacterium]HOH83195.1 SDR family oxidoreductase [Bacteroidales bacterium]HPB25766.1 SDR family oxidoreductase [Bacteroidales bacterium]HPI31153.1 SDR family oxidoreductase [Bacteroidales bacterium]HQN16612.1 SDR family oxidoreductase [Bacteroidales bacterium]